MLPFSTGRKLSLTQSTLREEVIGIFNEMKYLSRFVHRIYERNLAVASLEKLAVYCLRSRAAWLLSDTFSHTSH